MVLEHAKLNVRQTTLDDIDGILHVRQDPNVVPHQYRLDENRYSKELKQILGGGDNTGVSTTRYSSLDQDGELVGYVRHDHYSIEGVKMISCAWNLSSTYWGRGIMKVALTQLLDEWIYGLEVQHIFADHFQNNLRCKRLLDGLGFTSQHIPILERWSSAWQFKCLEWVLRKRLDAICWTRNTKQTTNSPMDKTVDRH